MFSRIFRSPAHRFGMLCALLLITTAAYVMTRWSGRQAFADGCDSFGYLRLAQVVRESIASRRMPEFKIVHPQIDALREMFERPGISRAEWGEAIAPHAHHYNPISGTIGIQYPPGTGLVLAPFPVENSPVWYIETLTLGLLLTAMVFLARAWKHDRLETMAPVVFAFVATMIVCDTVRHFSYSFQACLPFLIGGTALLIRSRRSGKRRHVVTAALLLTVSSLCRLPVAFHLPAWALLAAPGLRLIFAGVFGVTFGAIILVYNWHVTGSPWASTYSPIDNAAPSLGVIGKNLHFYFLGAGNQLLWALALIFLLTGTLVKQPRWRREWGLAIGVLVALPLGYFLTHAIDVSYYLHPTWVSLIWAMALARSPGDEKPAKNLRLAGILFATILVSLIALAPLGKWHSPEPVRSATISPELRPILSDDRAWVWADFSSGSFWYYWKKPAQKMTFAAPELRFWTAAWIRDRRECLYLVEDSEAMSRVRQDLEKLGWKFDVRGEAFGHPVFADSLCAFLTKL